MGGLRNLPIRGWVRWGLVIGFSLASFVGTYLGVLAIMKGDSDSAGPAYQQAVVGGIVLLLTIAMVYALFRARDRINWPYKFLFAGLYMVLVAWSVSFGFAFWWGFISAREVTLERVSASLDELQESLNENIGTYEAKLARLNGRLETAESRMRREAASGGSCGIDSPPGEGPLFLARQTLNSDIRSVIGQVDNGLAELERDVSSLSVNVANERRRLANLDRDEREREVEKTTARFRREIPRLNGQFSQRVAGYAGELNALAARMDIAPERGRCSDPEFAVLLRLDAEVIGNWVDISVPEIRSAEGTASTVNALERLPDMVMAPVSAEARNSVRDGDWIALAVAMLIDLCVFIFAMMARPSEFGEQTDLSPGQVRTKMRALFEKNHDLMKNFMRHRFGWKGRDFMPIPARGEWARQLNDKSGSSLTAERLNDRAVIFKDAGILRPPSRWSLFGESKAKRKTAEAWLYQDGWELTRRSLTTLLPPRYIDAQDSRDSGFPMDEDDVVEGLAGIENMRIRTPDLAALLGFVEEGIERERQGSSPFADAEPRSDLEMPAGLEQDIALLLRQDAELWELLEAGAISTGEQLQREADIERRKNKLSYHDIMVFGRTGDRIDEQSLHTVVDEKHSETVRRGDVLHIVQHGVIDNRRVRKKKHRAEEDRVIYRAKVIRSKGPESGRGFAFGFGSRDRDRDKDASGREQSNSSRTDVDRDEAVPSRQSDTDARQGGFQPARDGETANSPEHQPIPDRDAPPNRTSERPADSQERRPEDADSSRGLRDGKRGHSVFDDLD